MENFVVAYMQGVNKAKFTDQVASHDVAIINQANRDVDIIWRAALKAANPDIKILCYQQVAHEALETGDGNKIMYDLRFPWPNSGHMFYETAAGYVPVYRPQEGASPQTLMYDYRLAKWQDAFHKACDAVLDYENCDGLFLDNCTVWKHVFTEGDSHAEATVALGEVLLDLRRRHPTTLITGNGAESWPGLNGEMVEATASGSMEHRLDELIAVNGQTHPNMNMYLYGPKNMEEFARAPEFYAKAKERKALFGIYLEGTYQTPIHRNQWPDMNAA